MELTITPLFFHLGVGAAYLMASIAPCFKAKTFRKLSIFEFIVGVSYFTFAFSDSAH